MIKMEATQLIGNTPIVKLNHLVPAGSAAVYVKLEGSNMSGSIKVRAALGMIEGAEKDGALKPGMTIVEPTSGNTGIALALIGKMKGYQVIIVMPDTMSVERRNIIKAYGAELILTDGKKGMSGAIAEATAMAEAPKYFMPQQFNNGYNSKIHYETTGVEIVNDFKTLDAFVATIGTGGTVTGVGKRLKEHYQAIEVVGVEPAESPVLSGGSAGPHKIQGIGAGFVPSVLELKILDEVIKVSSDDALQMTKRLLDEEGLFVGISSGAAVVAALRVAERLGTGKSVLTISPDSGDKYISSNVF
ncbi:cysteine synthase A [Fusibacter paucivorans]|uniref:Cysteine synthase A n=1 Tax=Fusibacter paucivorans TaxID=76009 RepID=A0ABS5PVQ4_9FIRM|nr:cysteine synthase A [Fusibacter paucivorans]MBS7528634.1 cysteine synthase A [Fusibacter paucivorans]